MNTLIVNKKPGEVNGESKIYIRP